MRPEAEGYVGSYVRAIHDFHTDLAGEVSLLKGEVFKVTRVIDKNWLQGKNNQKEGNFPTDFVEKLVLPLTENGQKVFAATENFPAQQDGDLEFRKGDVLLGLAPIDDFWWHGKNGRREGMFPVTHVIELEVSKLLKARSKSVHSSETLFAQALRDAVGQLDEELSFQIGDIIKVTEVIDDDWYVGEVRGKSGMFLASCVQLLNEDECNANPEITRPGSVPVTHTQNYTSSGSSSGSIKTEISSQGSFNQSKFQRQTNVPTQDNSVVDPSHVDHEDRTISYTSENTKAHNDIDGGVTPYGRTVYPFVGELPDELSFAANDIVTLIQHVDEQWIEGELDGKIGVFPANYIEIVVDCPYAYSNEDVDLSVTESSVEAGDTDVAVGKESATSGNNSVNITEETVAESDAENVNGTDTHEESYALVLYEFVGETKQDLNVHEGETVSVIKTIDENWILVKNDHGKSGMVPVTYLEVIGAPPIHDASCHDNNENEIKTKSVNTSVNLNNKIVDSTGTRESESSSSTPTITHTKFTSESSSTGQSGVAAITSPSKFNTGTSDSSQHSTPSSTISGSSKPPIRQKPSIAPKPALKPKPSLTAKPWLPTSAHRPVTFDPSSSIPKSTSYKSLSQYSNSGESSDDTSKASMTKAQSMFEINRQSTPQNDETSLAESNTDNSGSNNSLSTAIDRRNSIDSQPKKEKAFEDWDLSQPLDSLIKSELTKARLEAEVKMRSDSDRSTGSDNSNKSGNFEPRPGSGNYCRENFESEVSIGNSTFFVNDDSDKGKSTRSLRKPPPPPSKTESKDGDFIRRPSLKKPAPQRPVGPRLAPAPSKTPMLPTRSVPSKLVPSRPAPAQPNGVPARPTGSRRKQTRPAPPRPGPAPPRPGPAPPRLSPAPSKPDNLMSFSPTGVSNSVFHVEEDDSEAVIELRTRVEQLETEIKDFEKSKLELEQMRDNVPSDEDQQEICDNIQFYKDNIDGYSTELTTLKEQLATLCPIQRYKMDEEKLAAERKIEEERAREEMRKKMEEQKMERKEKRTRVIAELVQTEKDFLTSLNLIMETFLSPAAEKHKEVDVEHLFGNIEEVADVSQKLLTKLEDATNGKDFSEQVLGSCFIGLAEDMKNVYAPYCRNHDDVIMLIEKYNQNSDIKAYLDRLLDKLRERHVVFDLEALLIKPVQRILKYPLLLNELTKSTEDSHPDKKEILFAIGAMTDVATAINEYKRRKDLVYKYKKDTDVSLGDKLSKLSLHSIKKKSSRIKERFSANLGFIDQTRDSNFDKEETRYRHLEKTVRVFIKDVQLYLDEVQNVVGCQESIAADIEDFYSEKRDLEDVQKYQSFCNTIHMTFLPNFQMEVEELVILPLNQMVLMFNGPNKVIQKRYDKLLDYDNMKRKAQNDKAFEKTLQMAKQNYEALNAQLLDELPKLFTLATQLFRDCVGSFVRAQREFNDQILQDMYTLLSVDVLHDETIIEQFNIKHTLIVDKLAMLSFMPRSFSPRVADQKQEKKNKRMSLDPSMLRSTEAAKQIDSQRIFVTQQYAAAKLFRVIETHVATDGLELSLCEGDVVGVIVEKDPMGNKERWFVDNGATKGFVPKKVLTLFEASPSRPLSMGSGQLLQPNTSAGNVSPNLSARSPSPNQQLSPGIQSTGSGSALHSVLEVPVDDMDFALEEEMMPDIDVPDNTQADDELELYYAEFAFDARNENEVSLFEHQVVTVIAMHDQEGNPEWWYVEADGKYGYAPAAYLHRMDSHGGPT